MPSDRNLIAARRTDGPGSKAEPSGLAGNRISLDHPDQTALARFKERHYSVDDVAEMWKLSPDPVRKLFEHESGVLVLGNHGSRSKRRYTTLRIPESVVERVHRRLCNPNLTAGRPRA